jgi:predicted transcriptional regulator
MKESEIMNELLATLKEEYYLEPLDPENEVTVQMLATELGISPWRAQSILEAEVKAGRLTARKARNPENGRHVYAYRKA